MPQTEKPLKPVKFCLVRSELPFKASRAEDLIRMLRNTLPAEKSAALRATGRRFTKLMVVTTLVCQVWHRGFNCQYS
jgi:hypothetical protein